MPFRLTTMKIILTGANGFIGSEILQYCLKSIYITHIYAITRRPLDPAILSNPKVTQILRDPPPASPIGPDTPTPETPTISSPFTSWPADELALFASQNVQGCIWCLGGPTHAYLTPHAAHLANTVYPLAAAQAFAAKLVAVQPPASSRPGKPAPRSSSRPFRFVYMSCAGAEPDAEKYLWTTPSAAAERRSKGATEKALFELARSEPAGGRLEVYALRLGKVLPGTQTVGNVLTEAVTTSVSVARVAKTAVDVVLDGWGPEGLGKVEGCCCVLENAQVLGDGWAEINTIT